MGVLDSFFSTKSTNNTSNSIFSPKIPADAAPICTVQVNEIYNLKGIGLVPAGTILSGTLYPQFYCQINNKKGIVESIEAKREVIPCAHVGEKVAFRLRGLEKSDLSVNQKIDFIKP